MYFGAAWYPEHWPEEAWAADVHKMAGIGFNVVRMAEFAWSSLEPQPGEYRLDWLERAIDLAAGAGLQVVLGTPSAAPPAWLTAADPETLAMDPHGQRLQHGNRAHYCVNSPAYQAAVGAIVSQLAERFGSHPAVIGWQIDNEYHRVCYCPVCRAAFQQALRRQFGDLETLNARWTTAYWSQAYTDWAQIPFPVGAHNPGLMLAAKRFVSESYRRFQALQIARLRPHLKPDDFITHNFFVWWEGPDPYSPAREALSQDLDFASWDWYIGQGHLDPVFSASAHDCSWGLRRRNHWVMETQPGTVNWAAVNNALSPGELRRMAWQAAAHGAEAVLYWQWRTMLGGQEQYHGALLDASGQERPFVQEIRQVAGEFAQASAALGGTHPKAEVALLNCYQSRAALTYQPHHRAFDYTTHLRHYYAPLLRGHIPAHILPPEAELAGYRLVIAPALHILTLGLAARLQAYVEAGGRLALTCRTGFKDEHNALWPLRGPGLLAELAGVEVEDYYALDEPVSVNADFFNGQATIWAERLRPRDETTHCLAVYGPEHGWLSGRPAISAHPYGAGWVYYVGAWLDDAAQASLVERLAAESQAAPLWAAPPEVEIGRRVGADGCPVYVVINHAGQPCSLDLPAPLEDILQGGTTTRLELEAQGVAVLAGLTW